MVFGIPDEIIAAGAIAFVALVAGLKVLGPKREVRPLPKSGSRVSELMATKETPQFPSAEELSEEEDAEKSVDITSIESLLARPIDEVPSIGADEKTDIDSGLEGLLKGNKPAAKAATPAKPVAPEPPKKAKNLIELSDKEADMDIDLIESEVDVPSPAKKYDQGPEGLEKYCMRQFDTGVNPRKAEQLLRLKGMPLQKAKELSYKEYKIWVEKREPIIKEMDAVRETLKTAEYQFLKGQIDSAGRDAALKDAKTKLSALETRLKASEDFF